MGFAVGLLAGVGAGATSALVVAFGAGVAVGIESVVAPAGDATLVAAAMLAVVVALFGAVVGSAIGGAVGATTGILLGLVGGERYAPIVAAALAGCAFGWIPLLLLAPESEYLVGLLWLAGLPVFTAIGCLAGQLFVKLTDRGGGVPR